MASPHSCARRGSCGLACVLPVACCSGVACVHNFGCQGCIELAVAGAWDGIHLSSLWRASHLGWLAPDWEGRQPQCEASLRCKVSSKDGACQSSLALGHGLQAEECCSVLLWRVVLRLSERASKSGSADVLTSLGLTILLMAVTWSARHSAGAARCGSARGGLGSRVVATRLPSIT